MNTQETLWQGRFGDEYTTRNRVDWLERLPFWQMIATKTGIDHVCELGCNAGWNLLALRHCGVDGFGIDINAEAIRQARAEGLRVTNDSASRLADWIGLWDMTFTCGVLIHIAPEQLSHTMDLLIQASRRYVLAVEYEAPEEEEVIYRGMSHALWRRAYGDLYQEKGLRLIESGDAVGFDRCKYWLMSK